MGDTDPKTDRTFASALKRIGLHRLPEGTARWLRIPEEIAATWKVERYLEQNRVALLLGEDEARIHSTALGICQHLLQLRLPAHAERDLAKWLIAPESAPHIARRTVELLLSVQHQRNALQSSWCVLGEPEISDAACARNSETSELKKVWLGLPVFPGIVEGEYSLESRAHTIHVFESARPQTVVHFEHARAVLYCQGGLLSHACSIARERGIPCITGLGSGFFAQVREKKWKTLAVDCAAGTVRGVD